MKRTVFSTNVFWVHVWVVKTFINRLEDIYEREINIGHSVTRKKLFYAFDLLFIRCFRHVYTISLLKIPLSSMKNGSNWFLFKCIYHQLGIVHFTFKLLIRVYKQWSNAQSAVPVGCPCLLWSSNWPLSFKVASSVPFRSLRWARNNLLF